MAGSDEGGGVDQPEIMPLLAPHEFPPPSTTVQVTFGAQSRRGRSRLINEDHYLVLQLGRHQETLMTSLPDDAIAARFDEYGYAMVVADGMGGTGAGEAASHLAIATLVYLVRRFGKWNLRVDDAVAREIMARAERFYRHVDSSLMYQRHTGGVRADQTTLTAVFGAGRDLFFAHVGHSRAYLFRNGGLMRLTRDHTIGQQSKMAMAPLVDVTASARDLEHILTDAIGMSGALGPTIDIERFELLDNDCVLVCTNGLTDLVDEEGIGGILGSEQSPDHQCRSLVDLAMAAGGDDDVTVLVARYRLPR
jgi:PPM family protein phosphatase